MKVFIFNKQEDLSLCLRKAKVSIKFILNFLKIKTDEISVHFVSKTEICNLHKEIFNDPSFTDTITLPMDKPDCKESYHILGECFVCPEAAKDVFGDSGATIELYQETTLYLIHSILHLVGFNDTNTEDKKKMRLQEKIVLNAVINNDMVLSKKKSFTNRKLTSI